MKKYFITVLAILMLSSFAFAQSDIGFKGVGGKLGYIMPEGDIENTIAFGAVVDLGTITPTIHLNGLFEYWGKSYDIGYYEWSWSELIFGANAKYYLSTEGQFLPYGGAGLALVIGSSKWDYKGPHDDFWGDSDGSDSQTDIGFFVCAGADYPLSDKLTGFAEAKYHLNGADFFGIFVGAVYKLK